MDFLSTITSNLTVFTTTIGTVALLVTASSVLYRNARIVMRRTAGQWYYSILAIVTILATAILGMVVGTKNPNYTWLIDNLRNPLTSAMSSLLGFQIVSTAYRYLTFKNVDSFVIIGVTVLVMLSAAPFGEALWAPFGPIGAWIIGVPNSIAGRAFMVCAAVGSIITSLRILLGLEAGYLGRE